MTSLRDFLAALPEREIVRFKAPRDFVPTALAMELESRDPRPVIWLEPDTDNPVPVVLNLFADKARIARLAGGRHGDFNAAWADVLRHSIPPRLIAEGAVHERVFLGSEVDCTALPISRHFAEDAGRYVNSGIFVCKDPDTGVRNLSFARMLLRDRNRFAINLGSRGDLWEHQGRAAARGKNLEVAVVIGAQPAVYLAASAKVAMNIDEYDIAGTLLGKPLDLVRCKAVDLEVPADAEFVLEGEILADASEDEGPMAEYTGYSSPRSTRNVMIVKALTHRAQPIYLDITPGASSEHLQLAGIARQARDYTRLKEMIPGLRALNFPRSGNSFHAYLSLKKNAEGEARRAISLLFGLDPYVKLAVAVDEDVDVENEQEVLWAIATRFQADTDMFVIPRMICNRGDPSAVDGMAAKVGMDATVPIGWQEQRATLSPDALAAARKIIGARGK
ncbi:MAG: UbiD family decarboxylase [Bradyrhizobiaceae bacterium]|nr:UbiD family decarboxylase [Bradyrhizobiaceae bacterium]